MAKTKDEAKLKLCIKVLKSSLKSLRIKYRPDLYDLFVIYANSDNKSQKSYELAMANTIVFAFNRQERSRNPKKHDFRLNNSEYDVVLMKEEFVVNIIRIAKAEINK